MKTDSNRDQEISREGYSSDSRLMEQSAGNVVMQHDL